VFWNPKNCDLGKNSHPFTSIYSRHLNEPNCRLDLSGQTGFHHLRTYGVSRYLRQLKRMPDETKASQRLAFLNNHREVIATFDLLRHQGVPEDELVAAVYRQNVDRHPSN
jgi:hypothetical protein